MGPGCGTSGGCTCLAVVTSGWWTRPLVAAWDRVRMLADIAGEPTYRLAVTRRDWSPPPDPMGVDADRIAGVALLQGTTAVRWPVSAVVTHGEYLDRDPPSYDLIWWQTRTLSRRCCGQAGS